VRLGIDLGGTKIEIIALSDDGAVLCRRRVATPAHDYAAIVEAIATLVRSVEGELGCSGTLGIGTPGALTRGTGLLKNSNSTALNGKPLQRDIEHAVGRPIRLANDANCLTLSEAIDGAGRSARVVFGAILGTGVGGGIAVEQRILEGRNTIAGEWGHNELPWRTESERPGRLCYCGKNGCIETFLSGPGLAADFNERTQRTMSARDIAAAADAGDVQARDALAIYEDRLARGLAHVVNIIDPDTIVLGGGLSNVERLYRNVPALIEKYVISAPVSITIARAEHGDSSGVRGAAWLWSDARGAPRGEL